MSAVATKKSFIQTFSTHLESSNRENFRAFLKETSMIVQNAAWDDNPCWITNEFSYNAGYMRFNRWDSEKQKYRGHYVHRSIAQFFYGDTTGRSVHHKCAERACVNPDHLEVVSQKDNVAEMLARRYYEDRIKTAEELLAELLDTLPAGEQRSKVETFLAGSAAN